MKLINIAITSTIITSFAPADAAIYRATNSNLLSVFAKVVGGDTILLSGDIDATRLKGREFSSNVTISATTARFTGQLIIDNVKNLRIYGGNYGSITEDWQKNSGAIFVMGGENVSIVSPNIVGNPASAARGIIFRDTSGASVNGGVFTGLYRAVEILRVKNGNFINNLIENSTSDGFNIISSRFVTVRNNVCVGSKPAPGAHADCVQLWSLPSDPVQSDIFILANKAYGDTQGFTSFTPEWGGGLRITMSDNYVNINFVHGIACYACNKSTFSNNIISTASGALHQTRMTVLGENNRFINNTVLPKPNSFQGIIANNDFIDKSDQTPGFFIRSDIEEIDAELEGFVDYSQDFVTVVPESMTWVQMFIGLLLVGIITRAKRLRTLNLA